MVSRLVRSSVDRVELLINRKKELWKDLKKTLDTLKFLMSKVKKIGVKDNVDRAITHFNKLLKSRGELHAEV